MVCIKFRVKYTKLCIKVRVVFEFICIKVRVVYCNLLFVKIHFCCLTNNKNV